VFGLSLITKTEKIQWKAIIQDLREEVARLRKERDEEKARANAAVNLALALKTGAVLTPEAESEREMQQTLAKSLDLFESDEDAQKEQEKLLRDIQGG
jgi:hypothetical protein